jgi:hypothetical protein
MFSQPDQGQPPADRHILLQELATPAARNVTVFHVSRRIPKRPKSLALTEARPPGSVLAVYIVKPSLGPATACISSNTAQHRNNLNH